MGTHEKNILGYDILHDAGNKIAQAFGIQFVLSETLRPIFKEFGIDIEKMNGDTSFTLPIPATYVIKKDGTIVYAFVDVDYTKRLNPEDVLAALRII